MSFHWLLWLAALAGSMSDPAVATAQGYVVVVNAGHEGTSVSRKTLSNLFLKKVTRWSDGSDTYVVDQSLKSDVRAAFSEDALGLSPLAVMNHWHQELLAGRTRRPPQVKGSDAEVIEFVSSQPGAIGYVVAGTPLGPAVKALVVVD